MNEQIGWSVESKLLRYILKQLDRLAGLISNWTSTPQCGLSIQSAVVVETTSNAKTNGAALIAAYTAAKALTPNGAALSATNRASVIIPPGVYDLGSGALTLDTQYVDIIGLTTDAEKQFIYSVPTIQDTGTLVQTANDVRIANIKAKCEISQELLLSIFLPEGEPVLENVVHVPAAYFPSTNLSGTVCDNSIFEGGDISEVGLPMGFSMRVLIEYSGTFNYCTGGAGAFGGAGGTASGTFNSCTGGDFAFGGYGGTASGTFTNCTGGNNAFGGNEGTASGTFNYCTGGVGAFGGGGTASGTFNYCTGGAGAFGGAGGTASGTFNYCTGGVDAFGGYGGTASGVFTNCTGGDFAFGSNEGTASGTFTNCTGGAGAFGSGGTASGTFTNCTGGGVAFGGGGTASGTFTNCTGGNFAFGGGGTATASGTFTNCTGGADAFGGAGGMLSGQLYYCRLTTGSFQTLAEGGKLRACVDGSDNFIATLDYEGQE